VIRRDLKAAATAAVSALALAGGAAAQTLNMGVGSPVTSLDPHFHQLSPNNAVSDMIFDKLIETDEKARNQPGLATEWRAVGPTTWEFKLREGVRFHNGNPSRRRMWFSPSNACRTCRTRLPPSRLIPARSCGWRWWTR
jgi:peptide/nickel transport system substrate-binding protein